MSEIQSLINNTVSQYQAGQLKTPKTATADEEKAAKTAQDFEAVFISQMLTPMFEGIEPDGMFGGGSAENIYKSMMLQEYGKLMAANGGLGIADSVKTQILALQEKQHSYDEYTQMKAEGEGQE